MLCGPSRETWQDGEVDIDVVRQAPLFAALSDEDAQALLQRMSRARIERGDVLFEEGEPGDRLYVITSGKVKLGRRSPDGRENLLAVLGPGEMFGELSLFDPGARTTTATAVAGTDLVGLGHAELTEFVSTRPEVAEALLDLTQEELAQLVGASRETVNKALADFAGRGWLKLEARAVTLLDVERLQRRAR